MSCKHTAQIKCIAGTLPFSFTSAPHRCWAILFPGPYCGLFHIFASDMMLDVLSALSHTIDLRASSPKSCFCKMQSAQSRVRLFKRMWKTAQHVFRRLLYLHHHFSSAMYHNLAMKNTVSLPSSEFRSGHFSNRCSSKVYCFFPASCHSILKMGWKYFSCLLFKHSHSLSSFMPSSLKLCQRYSS